MQPLADDGPVKWATKSHLCYIAEQVSHHPPSKLTLIRGRHCVVIYVYNKLIYMVEDCYSDTYMGIKHENTEPMSAEYFHHRDTLAHVITLST